MIKFEPKTTIIPDRFFEIPQKVYPNQPWFWDNETQSAMIFSEFNPYFLFGKAAFLVVEDKARIVCFFDERVKHDGKSVAYFGYWETINDLELNKELFEQCEQWAKKKQAELLIGPINFNTYHRYRLSLSSNDNKPFLNEPYNPEYYPQLLNECGFEVLNSYISYIVEDKNKIESWYKKYNAKKDLMSFDDYRFEFITPKLWMEKLEEIHQKSEMIFGENFAYTPIDFATFQIKYGEFFSHITCPKTSLFVFDKNNEIVGTFINMPNYLDLVRLGVSLSEFNFEKYTQMVKKPTLLIKTVGMIKEHAHMGFMLIRMALEIIPNGLDFYDNYIFCLMQDDNYPSKLAKEFSNETKSYALYAKPL